MTDVRAGGLKFVIILGLFQVAFIILFGIFVEYDTDAQPPPAASMQPEIRQYANGSRVEQYVQVAPPDVKKPVRDYYPMFQDVHVMMFIGFGFLMTFLRKYGYSSLGINFLLAAFVIQWATLMQGFLHMHHGKIQINMEKLIQSDFASAVILITFGCVLGKLSPLQYIIMAFLEIAFFAVNEWIGLSLYKVLDVGGSIFVHAFGAYFGLAMSRVLYRWEYGYPDFNLLKWTTHQNDLFSMIGTIFLWLYWPSFNSALAGGELQQRAIINTYYALASCCIFTFLCSVMFKHRQFSMELVQNATLAGGVAIGATADLIVHPFGAMIIGGAAGILSCVGFHILSGILERKLKIHDTCGVNNLHGMPGIFAALISSVVIGLASESLYQGSYYKVFPMAVPEAGTSEYAALTQRYPGLDPGYGRTPLTLALYQLAALGTTLLIAIVGGIITGFIVRLNIFDPLAGPELFEDATYWEIPEELSHPQETTLRNRLRGARGPEETVDLMVTTHETEYRKGHA